MGFYSPSEQEAKRVGSSGLVVPKATAKKKVVPTKNGDVTYWSWDEICVVDDLVLTAADEEKGRAFLEALESEEYVGGSDIPAELMRVQVRVSDEYKSENQGRVLSDFMRFPWALCQIDDSQMKSWAEEYGGTNGSQDPRGSYLQTFERFQRDSRRAAQFLKALGQQDRLVNRSIFNGLPTIIDIQHVFSGEKVIVSFQQDDDGQYTNFRGYKEFKK